MKQIFLFIVWAVAAVGFVSTDAWAEKHEHRGVWMSGYINDWPNAKLTEENVSWQKGQCLEDLDSLQRNNLTTIYFHVRTMCDAMYDSKYEPWSSYISSARGVKPAFDPLAYLLENAHDRGLEVYAWLNPYRYLNSSLQDSWGSDGGDKNYENSHPEWLLKYQFTNKSGKLQTYTILNPALPEVKQRIVDIVADILSKYDVDGIVFDDYFYQNNLPESYDSADYQKYVEETTARGETPMSQMDWRRENVNDMVRMVNAYIKETKPWVRFGIGPAGVAASDSEVADKYDVEPSPGSDWQYNEIASDPLAWISEGTIDFISPQVYWTIGNGSADYAEITPWWYEVASKFDRHCYISQNIDSNFSELSNAKRDLQEFVDEVDINRGSAEVAPGVVYFPWSVLRRSSKMIDRKNVQLSSYLRYHVFQNKALSPALSWMKTDVPGVVSSVTRTGRSLEWTGYDNVRYTIYAVPVEKVANFQKEEEYLLGISYTSDFSIPEFESDYPKYGISEADLDKYDYAVAILDRYGNESGAVFVGSTVKKAETPALTYPENGEVAPWKFAFTWAGSSTLYELTVATDPELNDIVYRNDVTGNSMNSTEIYEFKSGTDYYWQVSTRGNNEEIAVSPVQKFNVDAFRVLTPSDGTDGCSFTPVISWLDLGEGMKYVVEIAADRHFRKLTLEEETEEVSMTVPKFSLSGNTTYYVRVAAMVEGQRVYGEAVSFKTQSPDGSAPVFVSPAVSGVLLHSNESLAVMEREGMSSTIIMLSEKNTFPPRSSYSVLLPQGTFTDKELSQVKIISKPLADGDTYYVRSQFEYVDAEGNPVQTDWSSAMSFVYDTEAGVESVTDDGIYLVGGDDAALVAREAGLAVTVYSADGKKVLVAETGADGRASLSMLPEGIYLVTVETGGAVRTFRLAR